VAAVDVSDQIKELDQTLRSIEAVLDPDQMRRKLADLNEQVAVPDLWDDQAHAQKVTSRLSHLQGELNRLESLRQRLDDLSLLFELAQGEEGTADGEDALREAEAELATVKSAIGELEVRTLLSGEYDERDALITIRAEAGGVDAADWAEMLMRMYLRWAERHGFKAEIVESTPGEEAGIRSATITVEGPYAYGYLKTERGTHRLVRISPFDFQRRRQTSFALVDPTPQVESDAEIEIRPEELKIDTYRATGAGGQNVNKTETAIRITHLPSGIVVSCQNERSQLQNRETAMRILKARLLEKRVLEQEAEQARERGEMRSADWGSQIRSYVLHPYTLVKDHRTGVEVGDPTRVLDGDIDVFIEAALSKPTGGTPTAQ